MAQVNNSMLLFGKASRDTVFDVTGGQMSLVYSLNFHIIAQMHRLVPRFIEDQYSAGRRSGSFNACAIFVDISGFTAISDVLMGQGQHGAEVLAGVIRNLFDPLIQGVFEQSGFVTNLAGDAFTAVFPHEPDLTVEYKRALATAWQVQQAMASVAQQETPYGTFTVSVKVGVSAGKIEWGILTSSDEERAVYYFRGSAIDGCTSAEKMARAGEIVLDSGLNEATLSIATTEPVGAFFRVTGITNSLPAPVEPANPPVDSTIARRFFPAEALRRSHGGELRQVVSMFISLRSALSVQQLEGFIRIIFELQDRYGGLLNRLDFGDKGANLLLFWGAPLTLENDVIRALNFILDLQSQTIISVNAGISYRIAHCGFSGSALAGEYTCHGRGTTLAARFMEASPRGDIWVDDRIADQAKHRFEIEFEEKVGFKGFRGEQRVFVLFERKESVAPIFAGELIGRQNERIALANFLGPLQTGRSAGFMVIWGEPGMGKSRLANHILTDPEQIARVGFTVFLCQTDEIVRESLNPFRYWLRHYFGQTEQQSDGRNKRSFNRKLDTLIADSGDPRLAAELDRTRSFLGALVNLAWPDSLYEQLEAQGRYDNSFSGLVTLLQAESQRQPVFLLLEDIHWLDRDSKAFLSYLSRELSEEKSYPIAIVATARPEANVIDLEKLSPLQEINLAQMSQADMEILAEKQLGSPIGAGLSKLIVERTEGNPFFAEQILRYLLEQDLIEPVEGRWRLKASATEAMPSDVRSILVARLDRLSREVKEMVQTASVLGREFELRLLSHMRRDDPEVFRKVIQAEKASIWSALNELRYLFKHALLRDAAYGMQARVRRQSLHRVAAEALEDLHQGALLPHYGELAHHFEQAQLNHKARRYLAMAAKSEAEAYHNDLAVDYYNRALQMTPVEAIDTRYELLGALEELHNLQGARDKQLTDLDAMDDLASQHRDDLKRSDVQHRRAWLFYWTSDYARALDAGLQAISLANSAKDRMLAGKAHYATAWVLHMMGRRDRARRHADHALSAARETQSRRDEGNVHNVLGMMSRSDGDYYAGRVHIESFLRIAREVGDKEREVTGISNLGVADVSLGDYAQARERFYHALELAREMGVRPFIAMASINLSWVATIEGHWSQALEYGEAALMVKQEIQHGDAEAEGLNWLGHAWLGLGHPEKASAFHQRSLQMRRNMNQDDMAMGARAGMARAALAQDDLHAAAEYVAAIISYLDAGSSLNADWEPLRIYLTCYEVLSATQSSRAAELLETAYSQLQLQAEKIPDAETRRMFLENVPWHREIIANYKEIGSKS